MAVIRFSNFSGMAPRLPPHLLPKGFAQTATNVDLRRGMLEPLKAPSTAVTVGAAANTIFLHSSGKWLAWTNRVDVAESPVSNTDYPGRVFWTDGAYPKQSSTSLLAISGDYALDTANHYHLGVPAPGSAPSVGLATDIPEDYATTRTFVWAWVHKGTVGGKTTDLAVTLGPTQSAYIDGMKETPPAHYPTSGTTPAKETTWQKWIFEIDPQTGQFVLCAKLTPKTTAWQDDGKRLKRYSSSATIFNPSLIAAPGAGEVGAIHAQESGSQTLHGRTYVYCWKWKQSDGTWRRSPISTASASVDASDTDQVAVTGMDRDYGTLPGGVTNIGKLLFRTDGNGDYRMVARMNRYVTEYRDTKPTKKLGLKLSHWTLGTPVATPAAPTVAVANENAIEQITRAYLYTWVTAWGEESAPSDASDTIDLFPWQEAQVTTETTAPYANVTVKRIYRTDVNGDFRLVADLPYNAGAWTDSVDDADLGDSLASTSWDAPPDALTGLVALPNGVLAGFVGNQIMFSEVGVPYAWPVAYRYAVPVKNIVGLAVTDGGVLVLTDSMPYVCRGFDPSAAAPELIRERAPCLSAKSIVDMGGWAVWASADGLMSTRSGSPALETAGILTREQWQAYGPSTLVGGYWQGRYVGFKSAGGAFVFDIEGGHIIDADVDATATYADPATDTLYVHDSDIGAWNGGAALNYDWKSSRALLDAGLTPFAARVDAATYPLTLKLYADGTLRQMQTVANNRAFRLPGGYRGFAFEVEMLGSAQVRQVTIASTMEELIQQ